MKGYVEVIPTYPFGVCSIYEKCTLYEFIKSQIDLIRACNHNLIGTQLSVLRCHLKYQCPYIPLLHTYK